MYSQNDEERHIQEHFGTKVGRFLDIGAYDGKLFSNTFALFQKHWRGVEVEASPINFGNLMMNVRNKDVDLLCAALTVQGGLLSFYDSQGDAISSSDKSHVDKWSSKAGGVDWQLITVPSLTPLQLLEYYGYDFDMVDIDVEGTSYEVFLEFPWEELKNNSLIVIEHDENRSRIIDRVSPLGYSLIYENAENLVLTR